MWFVWLVLGAMIGSVGGWGGAFIGATVGAVGGWFAAQSARAAAQRHAAIEKTLRELRTRLEQLERTAAETAASAPTAAPAAAPITPSAAAPAEPEASVPPESTPPARDAEPLSIPPAASPEDVIAFGHARRDAGSGGSGIREHARHGHRADRGRGHRRTVRSRLQHRRAGDRRAHRMAAGDCGAGAEPAGGTG